MSVELTDSETLKNLMRAFAGESQARNRYTFAASLCKQQSLPVLEAVFQFTANQCFEALHDIFSDVLALNGAAAHQAEHFQFFSCDVISID